MTEPPPPPNGPGEPQYPAWNAPPEPTAWGPPAPVPRAPVRLGEHLGVRLVRRPEPRFGISLAGMGAALLLLGTFIWTGGYLGDGLDVRFTDSGVETSGESRRFLGAALFLVLAVVGYAVAMRMRRGALATAGAVTAAFSVPLAIGFVSLDVGGMVGGGGDPVNLDAVLLISVLVWLISYVAVPGIRGRALFLAAALVGFSGYVAVKAGGTESVGSAASSVFGGRGAPDTSTFTAIALLFGVAYYVMAALLDRRGKHGAAVAFVVAGFDATVGGVVAGVADLEQAGTGVLLLFLGAGLAWYGARFGRRFTTWAWSLGFALGVVLIISDIAPDNYTAAGISLMVLGVLVTGAAYAVSQAAREAPDIEEQVAAG